MLKKFYCINTIRWPYLPGEDTCLIDTESIEAVVPAQEYKSYKHLVLVRLKSGFSINCVGEIKDFYE